MSPDLSSIDEEWNELASADDDVEPTEEEIVFLDDDDLLEFVHDTEF